MDYRRPCVAKWARKVMRFPSSQERRYLSRRAALAGLGAVCGCAPTSSALVDAAPPIGARRANAVSETFDTALDGASRLTIPVRLDEAGPFPFVVDTGANVSVVSAEIAQQLGLPAAGTALVHGIAGAQETALARVRKLSAGAASIAAPRMPILPRGQLGADGLLGMDLLRGRRLIIDNQRGRIEIARTASSTPAPLGGVRIRRGRDPEFVVPARLRFGQLIIVDAEVAGVRVSAFIDSGSQNTVGNLALKSAVARRGAGLAERLEHAPLISATGQVMTAEIASLPPLRLGGLLIGNLTIAFAPLHIFEIWGLVDQPALLVGIDLLRRFNSVEIDYGRRLVTFRPPAGGMTLRAP
jgi:predicted aspartyl protease